MLKDCVTTKRKITYDGGEFDVRGVSLIEVAGMIVNHREAVDRIALVIRTQREFDVNNMVAMIEVLIDVVKESPYLAADIICGCADEPDAYASAFRLPLTVQVEALRVIADLTFSDAVALKKLIADASGLMAGMVPVTPEAAAA